jgi:PAS domain S-box-containing protein
VKLRTQIVLLIALLTTGLGVVSAILAVRLTTASLEGELEKQAAILTEALVEPIAYDLINGEVLPVRETLETLVGRIEELEFAYVTDFDGGLFAHTFEGGFPRALLEHHGGTGMDVDRTPELFRYSTAEGPLLVVERPIVDGMRAYIDIGFSEARTRDQIERLRLQILGATLGAVLVGVLLGAVASERMTRPLGQLAETMRTFGWMSDVERVQVRGGGREVAELVEAFGGMVGGLARVEDALRESEGRYRAITDTAEDLIFCKDTDRRYTLVNPAVERLFGYPAAELLGRTPEELFDEESAAILAEVDARTLAGEVVSENRSLPVSGVPHVFHTVQVPLRDAEGRIIGLSGIVRDVTGRVRLESQRDATLAALRESEEKYRLLFENMMAGFALHEIVLNEKGEPVDYVFLEANSAFERLTGLKRNDLIGKRVTEVIPGIEEDPADWIGRYGKVALTGQEIRFAQHAQPLGKWYAVLAFSPRKGQFATTFEDVTERVRADEELRRHRDHLEELVADRTAELRRVVDLMAGREVRMAELKVVIRELRGQLLAAGMAPAADDPLLGEGAS